MCLCIFFKPEGGGGCRLAANTTANIIHKRFPRCTVIYLGPRPFAAAVVMFIIIAHSFGGEWDASISCVNCHQHYK